MNLTSPATPASRRHDGARFPVRRQTFDFDTVHDLYVHAGNPLASYFWIVLQAKFPDGEQFFIDSVRALREHVTDAQLQKDVSAFIGQEAMHGHAHREVNAQLEQRFGIPMARIERRMKSLMAWIQTVHTPKQCLAATVGAEHLTAVVARFLLRHPDYLAGFGDPVIRRLVMWHALEEREHRTVAFDVYQQSGGGYFTRVAMLPWFAAMVLPSLTAEILRLMARDGSLKQLRNIGSGLASLFGRHGLVTGSLPALLDYFRPGFHPSDDDQTALELGWRRELGLIEP